MDLRLTEAEADCLERAVGFRCRLMGAGGEDREIAAGLLARLKSRPAWEVPASPEEAADQDRRVPQC